MSVESLFAKSAVEKLEEYRGRIDVCLGKLDEAQIWERGGENENAIGNLILHLAGNVRQWIVCSLGGIPVDRDRDSEFDARGGFTSAQLSHKLRETVDAASTIIERLTTEQLTRSYEVQIYKVSGVEAVFHVVEHFAHHAGQIIFVTKMLTATDLGFYSHLRSAKAGSTTTG